MHATPSDSIASAGTVEITAAPRASHVAKGAISELRACAFLMDAGYYVYRCESPAAPFDLVAYKEGTCHRVEVKTVSYSGGVPSFSWPKNDQWDLLLVVERGVVFSFAPGVSYATARDCIRQHHGFGPVREKLSPDAIWDCSARRDAGETWADLALEYGVSVSALSDLVTRYRTRRRRGLLALAGSEKALEAAKTQDRSDEKEAVQP